VFHIEHEEIETVKDINDESALSVKSKDVEDDIDLVENYKKRQENGLNIYRNKYKYRLVDTNKVSFDSFSILTR
jgi:hypothetical protein